MVKKVIKYVAMDGNEFPTHAEAFEYEKGLQLVKDLQSAILDCGATVLDDRGRPLYNIPPAQALTIAELLATTDLYSRLRSILK